MDQVLVMLRQVKVIADVKTKEQDAKEHLSCEEILRLTLAGIGAFVVARPGRRC